MTLENWLLGEPAADVRATMREEGCEDCFGCPHATVMASVISSMANAAQEFTTRIADIGSDLLNDSTNKVAKAIKNQEDLQEDYRAQLHAITQPCVGWLDGAGTAIAPRPA